MRLPIDEVIPSLCKSLMDHGNVVLHAPTGAGKTTRVPPAVLDALGSPSGLVVVTQPRRVAARSAARRMAEEAGERLGQRFGYHVRHERVATDSTRVLVVTHGMLLRMLLSDPFLESVDCVILDEVHERSLHADLVLAMVRHLQREVRSDLKLVAMSATADTKRLSSFLDAPITRCEGRTFPVELRYLPHASNQPISELAATHALQLADDVDGDVLVFLPGVREIRATAGSLAARGAGDREVVPLHGRLSSEDQDRALRPGQRQRIVLATNVAETSVTLPRVRAVVDTGLVRTLRHDSRRGLDRLEVAAHSRASADQRAGRAGRTAPGIAMRLWSERQHEAREAHDTPEIQRVDLAGVLLTLRAWGEPDPAVFPWFEAPPAATLARAERLLQRLGATRDGQLTATGESMARLPVQPRLARMLIEAHQLGATHEAAWAAAVLGERVPTERTGPPRRSSDSDLADLLDAVHGEDVTGWRPIPTATLRYLRTSAMQLQRAVEQLGPPGRPRPDGLQRAILAGFPDRVAMRRRPGEPRVKLSSGRGARLHPHSAVWDATLLVALDVRDQDGAEALIYLASAIDVSWLQTHDDVIVRYDADRDRVVGTARRLFHDLVIDTRDGVQAHPAEVAEVLLAAAQRFPSRAWPADDKDLARLVGRLRFIERIRPDLELPPHDMPGLIEAGRALTGGLRDLAGLKRAGWAEALTRRLTWAQRSALDNLAPATWTVPSGSAIRLDYPDEGPPVLAVRIQEMFGARETPRIAGRPVLLHLLAPNQRPQQVTDDLAGFWERTYPEVRRDLRRRYPKHAWPDDPLTAQAERRPRRKR